METIGKIRCREPVKNENISEVAQELKQSRNTVKKYLKAGFKPVYQRRQGQADHSAAGSHHCNIIETGNNSFHFKQRKKPR